MNRHERRERAMALGKFAVFAVGVLVLVCMVTVLLVRAMGLDAASTASQSSDTTSPAAAASPLPSSALPLPKGARKPGPLVTPSSGAAAGIQLTASPKTVAPGGHITLSGSTGSSGTLQVQRKESGTGWTDFPVTISAGGGSFSTYVMTSHTGTMQWRVHDTSSGKNSNAVTVQVG